MWLSIIKKKEEIISSIRKTFDKHPLFKFISVIILMISYIIFAVVSHGLKDGLTLSVLTWSFFVLCTPVADAGIILDFPMRLITGIKMFYSEVVVWIIALIINLFIFFKNPSIYDTTVLLSLFKLILDTPIPFWSIIILSGIGTFTSIYMADEFVDSKKRDKAYPNLWKKYKVIIFVFLILLILAVYEFLLVKLGVQIPLI